MSKLWAEVWTRPGDPNFGRIVDDPGVVEGSFHDGLNKIGDGTLILSDRSPYLDDILVADPSDATKARSSLVRIFSEADPTTPVFEWLPNKVYPSTDKNDRTARAEGIGIKALPAYARLEPYDWDGSDDFAPTQPDWEWGARNILSNPGFEDSQVTSTIFELTITATGGTYTLTDGTDTSSAIAYNAGSATILAAIENELGLFTDVVVAPAGTNPVRFVISMVDPAFGPTLSVNTGSLTGGTATINVDQQGGLSPGAWTVAKTLGSSGGFYTAFEVSDAQAHTGTYSLLVDPGPSTLTSNRWPGAQQIVRVSPGIMQASVWVYPTSGTDTFQLYILGIGEEVIATSTNSALTPNAWNQITISDLEVPAGTTEIIFRLYCTNPGPSNPSTFYIDDAELYPGLAPTTVGEIIRLLYEHATNSTLRSPIVWDDGSGTPYLTLDFTDSLDSAGAAWDDSEIRIKFTMRMSYSQIMAVLARNYGYEYRIVPDDVENGTWKWQVYNPGTMKVDHTASAAPAIQGGASDVRRSVARFLPSGTDTMVEGLGRVTSRARNSSLMTAIGRIETSRIDREAPDLIVTAAAADESIASLLTGSRTLGYTLVDPQDEPLSDYAIGDLLVIDDPPEVSAEQARLVDVVCLFSPASTEWEVSFGSVALLNPDAAIASAVAGLLTKFEYPDADTVGGGAGGGGAGGTPTIGVAASDASESSIKKADYVCTGTDDHEIIMEAMFDIYNAGGGRLWLSEGTFDCDPDEIIVGYSTTYPVPMICQGMGDATILRFASTATDYLVAVATQCVLRDLQIQGQGGE